MVLLVLCMKEKLKDQNMEPFDNMKHYWFEMAPLRSISWMQVVAL